MNAIKMSNLYAVQGGQRNARLIVGSGFTILGKGVLSRCVELLK